MVVRYWLAGDGEGGSGWPSGRGTGSKDGYEWPSSARLRRRSDFERVYHSGRRFSSPLFLAFALPGTGLPARVGFATPRALGKAVVRNRVRRRFREAVRMHFQALAAGWDVVFNLRRAALEAGFQKIEAEVRRYFEGLKPPGPEGV